MNFARLVIYDERIYTGGCRISVNSLLFTGKSSLKVVVWVLTRRHLCRKKRKQCESEFPPGLPNSRGIQKKKKKRKKRREVKKIVKRPTLDGGGVNRTAYRVRFQQNDVDLTVSFLSLIIPINLRQSPSSFVRNGTIAPKQFTR